MDAIGRYRVIRLLGHGGMAEVYLAHDASLERDVAIKLLHRDPSRRGLRDEAKTLAALRHPGIVTIYEIGEHEGREYIAMEYLPGRTLRQAMAAGAARGELLRVCREVTAALGAAHAAGIVHGDIKPENVVVGDGGAVVVVDFGIARRVAADHPATTAAAASALSRHTIPYGDGTADTVVGLDTRTPFGTPAYMAPEVLIGDVSTAASDVYGLGVMLFECLAGRRPHAGGDLVTTISQVIDEDAPVLDDPLGPIVARMLARSPADRPRLPEIMKALAKALLALTPVVTPSPLPLPPASGPSAAGGRRSRARSVAVAKRRSRVAIVVAACAVVAAAVAGGLYARDRLRGAPAPVALGVEPIVAKVPSYGAEEPDPRAIAGAVATLLAQVDGPPIAAAIDDGSFARVATVAVREVGGGDIEAIVWVRRRAPGGALEPAPSRTVTAHGFAPALDAIAETIARDVAGDDDVSLPPRSRARAQQLARLAEPLLDTGKFGSARPYLQLAVDADPTLFDPWLRLVMVDMWLDLAHDVMTSTFSGALAAAPDDVSRELVGGAEELQEGHFARAWRRLAPLAHPGDGSNDIDYVVGEAAWHDGQYGEGYAHFHALLEQNTQRYRAASVHAWQYEVAHRDAIDAARDLGIGNAEPEWAQFAAGDYERVAASGRMPFALWALRVLDRPPPADIAKVVAGDDLSDWLEQVGEHVASGDDAGARAMIAARPEVSQPGDGDYPALEELGEIELSAGYVDEARALVATLAPRPPRLVHGYQRLSMLLAAATGDRSLVVSSDDVTTRNRALGAAAVAKIDGRVSDAVTTLQAIVADPSSTWDYPERAELVRDLRTLRRDKDARAVCADTLRPAMYRVALAALRRLCQR